MAEKSGGHLGALSVADEYRTFELQLKAMLQHAAMAYPHQPSPTCARTNTELRRAQASLKVPSLTAAEISSCCAINVDDHHDADTSNAATIDKHSVCSCSCRATSQMSRERSQVLAASCQSFMAHSAHVPGR